VAGKEKYPWSRERAERALADNGGNRAAAARELGVPASTFKCYCDREGLTAERHLTTVADGDHVTSDDPTEWGDVPALLRSRGISPDDWVVVRVRVNEWADQRQLRVDLVPRSFNSLLPARSDGWRPPPRVVQAPKDDAELVVFFGDQHCPHHDPVLHAAACQWLRKNRPARGVLLGDLLDFDGVSRHRSNPEWATSMQECVDSAYGVLRGFIQASPGTRWQMVSGNHEDRLRNAIIDQLKGVYGLAQASGDDEPRGDAVLSVKHLLRLDELGVEWIGSDGEYTHQQIKVSPQLAARHGWIARKGSGSSARATLEHLGYSCVIGHTHRQSRVFHTTHDIDGRQIQLEGIEAGTMARTRGGLGYAPSPDWQQGFATARIWPDGFFSCDLAKFIDGSLVWANQRFAPDYVSGDLRVAKAAMGLAA
jgi:hypothetical protein